MRSGSVGWVFLKVLNLTCLETIYVTPLSLFYFGRWTMSSWSDVWRDAPTLPSSSSGWTPLSAESRTNWRRVLRQRSCFRSSAQKSATTSAVLLSSTQVMQVVCVQYVCGGHVDDSWFIMSYSLPLVDSVLRNPDKEKLISDEQTATQTRWVQKMIHTE